MSDNGLKALAWVVAAMWGISMLASIASALFPTAFPVRYDPPPPIHGIMLAVVGAISGVKIVRGSGDGQT